VMTGLSEAIFPRQANGSLVRVDGKIVGSRLIGQEFTQPQYFHPRPSAAGSGYDATQSGGSNLGPTSVKLILGATTTGSDGKETVSFDGIEDRIVHYCIENGLPYQSSAPLSRFEDAKGNLDDVKLIDAFNAANNPLVFIPKVAIPADAVTGSASGLDPAISPANAELQLARVAKARGVSPELIKPLIAAYTTGPEWGFLGGSGVNVLLLNIALNRRFRISNPTPMKAADAADGQNVAEER